MPCGGKNRSAWQRLRRARVYYDMSQGDGGDIRGPWNSGGDWEFVSDRDAQCAVDGGDGTASVKLF